METLLVITNCPDEETANAIALAAVEEKLAACVNILPRVQSIYRWQGKVESASEIPLFFKSTAANYPALPADQPRLARLPELGGGRNDPMTARRRRLIIRLTNRSQ